MYQQFIEPFGEFEKHTFFDLQGNAFSMVPQYGSCLLDLRFRNFSYLDGYQTPTQLIENQWAKNVILVPFPNRLRDGVYTHEGKMYQFPIKASAGNNAIHGFARNARMNIQQIELTAEYAAIHCAYEFLGNHPSYPFRFLLETKLRLAGTHFTMEMYMTNLDTCPIPVGMGWHPYFKFEGATAEQIEMQLPDCQQIVVDDRKLPTGELLTYEDFKSLRSVGSTRLDTGFILTEKSPHRARILLKFKNQSLEYWQDKQHWEYFQVFTPAHLQSVAVEPMSCAADAFNTGQGLKILPPKERFGGAFGVTHHS